MILKSIISITTALSFTAQAANVYFLSADNDLAIFSGDASGTALTEIYQNDTAWNANNSFTFTPPATGYIYVAAMNFGGVGGFSGGLNGTNIINLDWEYVDLNTADFTLFPTANDETYDVIETDFESALTSVTWLDASTVVRAAGTVTAGVIDETGAVNTSATHYIVPDAFSIRAFRIGVDDIPAAVPEPSSTSLLMISMGSLLLRRRRS